MPLVTYVGQQKTDVLEPETMLVLAVVKAAGHTMGPILQLVTVFNTVAAPDHHCDTSGGRHVNVFATDSPYATS